MTDGGSGNEGTPGQPPPPQSVPDIVPPEQMAGVWANFAQVSESPFEFTLDFVRIDYSNQQGVLVARVSMSPLFVSQLVDALQQAWQRYAERAFPSEVHGDETAGENEA